MDKQTKIKTMDPTDLIMLEPCVQVRMIRKLGEKGSFGDFPRWQMWQKDGAKCPEDVMAIWIYESILEPLGW